MTLLPSPLRHVPPTLPRISSSTTSNFFHNFDFLYSRINNHHHYHNHQQRTHLIIEHPLRPRIELQPTLLQTEAQIPLPLQRLQSSLLRDGSSRGPRGQTQHWRPQQSIQRRQQQPAVKPTTFIPRENRAQNQRGPTANPTKPPENRRQQPLSNTRHVRCLQSFFEFSGEFGDTVCADVATECVFAARVWGYTGTTDVPAYGGGVDAESTVGDGTGTVWRGSGEYDFTVGCDGGEFEQEGDESTRDVARAEKGQDTEFHEDFEG